MKLSAALSSALALAFAAALSACGGDPAQPLGADDAGSTGDAGSGSDAGTDAGLAYDAGPDAGITGRDGGNSDPAGCTASTAYGTVTAANQFASYTPSGTDGGLDDQYIYNSDLNDDTKVDYLDLELYGTYGAFANGVAPGTYTIGGADLDYATCGLCVLIYTDFDSTTNMATDAYFATSGTVTITALSPTLAGSISNVSFQHVTIDPSSFQSTPASDGCASSLDALAFSVSDNSSRQVHHRMHLARTRR